MWLNVPLTKVTKKDDFKWGSKEQEAFDNLKCHVTTRSILALPDFTKVFVISIGHSTLAIISFSLEIHSVHQ
jgi:hypothetical protein